MREVQARQHPRRHRNGNQQVDDGNDQGRGCKKAHDGKEDVPSPPLLRFREDYEREGDRKRRQGHHRQEVDEEAERTYGAREPHHERCLAVRCAFEGRPAFADQVVTDVRRTIVQPHFARGLPRQKNGGLSHLQLAMGTTTGNCFDGVSIAVAGKEVLTGVDPCRVEAQPLLHEAQILDELAPIERRDEA